MSEIEYPVRINRYLLLKGYCSRREADRIIQAGRVKFSGRRAVLGDKVSAGDVVEIDECVATLPERYVYYAYNKPRGVVSHNPQRGEKSVEDISGIEERVFPIGRLDKDSRGLMLLSDDGRIVDALLNPNRAHEKEYAVKVDKRVTGTFLNALSRGVNIEGYRTKPAQTKKLSEHTFSITLTEGKKHQIRRMCAALGYRVEDLKRTRILRLLLGNLPAGACRPLTETERRGLLETLTQEAVVRHNKHLGSQEPRCYKSSSSGSASPSAA